MTAGDIITGIENVANGAYLTFQPAAGVEVVIKNTGDENGGVNKHYIFLYNGTYYGLYSKRPVTGETINLYINNTTYFKLRNEAGSTMSFSYTGVQIK